jgi:hypothetical protein
MWNAIHLDREFATLREADQGVTDTEWELGCRVIRMSYKQEADARQYILRVGIAVLDAEAWNEMIREINGDTDSVTNNKFVSTHRPYDKWEQLPIIY